MATVLVLLGPLCGPWGLFWLLERTTGRRWLAGHRGTLGVCLLFLMGGVAHFFMTDPMARMLPAWVPYRVPLVWMTGVMEIALAGIVMAPAGVA